MFDFAKCTIKGIDISAMVKKPLLNFTLPVNQYTGAIKENIQIASYNGFDFYITNDKYLDLEGSFHKYHNNGLHNHNDFTINYFFGVLSDLHEKFSLNPFLCALHNLEFGVNIELPFNTNDLLNAIISYKGKEYEKREYNGRGYLLKFVLQQYEFKIYNKGHQYGLNRNILRVEIKVKKMEYFSARNIKINFFSDLLNPTEINKLPPLLLSAFNDLIIYDNSINIQELHKPERETITNGRNPKYWTELKKDNKRKFKYQVQQFKRTVKKHGKKNLQNIISELIQNKCNELLKINPETEQKINDFLNKFPEKSCTKITDFSTEPEKLNLYQNNLSNSMLFQYNYISEKEKRYCKSCGRDIAGQKQGSVFCSERIYGKTAKKCRNIDSNPRNNYKRKELKLYCGGNLLFDISTIKQQL